MSQPSLNWDEEQRAWAVLETWEGQDAPFARWQEELLRALQEIMNREGDDADRSEWAREAQLLQIAQQKPHIPARAHRELVKSLLDDMFRLGPLQPLWERPDVSDLTPGQAVDVLGLVAQKTGTGAQVLAVAVPVLAVDPAQSVVLVGVTTREALRMADAQKLIVTLNPHAPSARAR